MLPCAIVQLQRRIRQGIGNAILVKLRAYGTNNHPLWFGPLDNESSNHDVVARLHKSARGDVAKVGQSQWVVARSISRRVLKEPKKSDFRPTQSFRCQSKLPCARNRAAGALVHS